MQGGQRFERRNMHNVLLKEDLCHFLETHGNSRVKRELLLFWGKHPNTNFTKFALCYAVDCSGLQAEDALAVQMEAGLVEMSTNEHGLTLYSLTSNEDLRQRVIQIAEIDYSQLNGMLRLY